MSKRRSRRFSPPVPATFCRTRRVELGMSQLALAKIANVPQPYVSRIERGLDVRADDLAAVAKALGVEPQQLTHVVEGGVADGC